LFFSKNRISSEWIIFAFSASAATYFILTGREGLVQFIVFLIMMALVWKEIGPVIALSVLAAFIWSDRKLFNLFYTMTGPIWRDASFIEISIYAWSVILLAFGFLKKLRGRRALIIPPYFVFLLLFLAGGIAAFILGLSDTPDKIFAWRMLWKICICPLGLYFIIVNYVKTSHDGQRVLFGLIISGLVLTVFLYLLYRGGRFGGEINLGPLGSVFITYNNGSLYFGLIAALVWSILLHAQSILKRCVATGIMIALGLVVYASGTRSVFVALAIACAVVSFLRFKKSPGRWLLFSRFMIFAVFALAIVISLISLNLIGEQGFLVLDRLQSIRSVADIYSDPNFKGRMEIYQMAMETLLHNPLGTGYQGIPMNYGLIQVHNDYLALALATGISGLLSWLIFLGLATRRLFLTITSKQSLSTDWVPLGVLGSMITYIISIFFIDPSMRFYPYITFWLILSVGIAVARNSRPLKARS
jgi:O-antigen ligase